LFDWYDGSKDLGIYLYVALNVETSTCLCFRHCIIITLKYQNEHLFYLKNDFKHKLNNRWFDLLHLATFIERNSQGFVFQSFQHYTCHFFCMVITTFDIIMVNVFIGMLAFYFILEIEEAQLCSLCFQALWGNGVLNARHLTVSYPNQQITICTLKHWLFQMFFQFSINSFLIVSQKMVQVANLEDKQILHDIYISQLPFIVYSIVLVLNCLLRVFFFLTEELCILLPMNHM